MARPRFTPDGDIIVPRSLLEGFDAAQPIAARRIGDDLLLSRHEQPGQRERPILYGDLRMFHVAELLALISSMQRDGVLHVLVPDARKSIFFSGGEVVFASSTVEDDRLGEALWRQGRITLEQLSSVQDLVTPQKRLGALLVERGLISPRDLYRGIQGQVTEILFSAFHFHRGEFLFVEGDVSLKNAVRLEQRTRDLIAEGIRRVEVMNRLEEIFHDRDAVPVPRPMAVEVSLSEAERYVRGMVDGRTSVARLLQQSRLGELDTLRALAHLRRLNLFDMRSGREAAPAAGEDPLKRWTSMLRHIHQTLAAEEPEYVARLEAYLGSPPAAHRALFANVGFDADGRIDSATLVRNARTVAPDQALDLAREALRAFVDYAHFQALDVLDEAAGDRLSRRLAELRQRSGDEEG